MKFFRTSPSLSCVQVYPTSLSSGTGRDSRILMGKPMKPSSSLSLELQIINFQLMREKISSTSTRISTPLLCDDYKKIVEITLKFLGSELPAEKKFAWKKVRFMAWSLCSMKAFAFSSEMDCSKEIIKKLQCFTLFHVTIYIPQFLMSSIGSDAAINDLSLHKKLQKFRDTDEVIGEEAL